MTGAKMSTIKGILLCALILGSVSFLAAARRLAWDINGDVRDGASVMEAFFGNFLSASGVSFLEPDLTNDRQLLEWKIDSQADIRDIRGFEEKSRTLQSELLSLVGRIPVKYLGHWRMNNIELLLIFEAGGWGGFGEWGGTQFDASHNMGAAVYSQQKGVWHCTGYDLNLGWFGSYRTTVLNPSLVRIAENSYAVQTLSYSSALIGVVQGKPKVILRAPSWGGIGHGDPEDYSSTLRTESNESPYYDVIIESTGKHFDEFSYVEDATEEQLAAGQWDLYHLRKFQWDSKNNEYQLISSEGNINDIIDGGDSWFPSPEEYWANTEDASSEQGSFPQGSDLVGCVAQGELRLIDVNSGKEALVETGGEVIDLLWDTSGKGLYYLEGDREKLTLDCIALDLPGMTREPVFSLRVDRKMIDESDIERFFRDGYLFLNDNGNLALAVEYRYPSEYWSNYGTSARYYEFRDGILREFHPETEPNKFNPYEPLVSEDQKTGIVNRMASGIRELHVVNDKGGFRRLTFTGEVDRERTIGTKRTRISPHHRMEVLWPLYATLVKRTLSTANPTLSTGTEAISNCSAICKWLAVICITPGPGTTASFSCRRKWNMITKQTAGPGHPRCAYGTPRERS